MDEGGREAERTHVVNEGDLDGRAELSSLDFIRLVPASTCFYERLVQLLPPLWFLLSVGGTTRGEPRGRTIDSWKSVTRR
jgi:hypothetical protein